jgi:hemoglobin
MTTASIPTLYDSADGTPVVELLTMHFHERVRLDLLLAPVLWNIPGDRTKRVAEFITEVFQGPCVNDDRSDRHMLARHLGSHLTLAQRRRWMDLLLESAAAVGLQDDATFRSSLVAYLEWGSRHSPRAATSANALTPGFFA